MKSILKITLLFISILISINMASAQVKTENSSILIINENKAELQDYLSQMMQVFKDNNGKPIARYNAIENIVGDDSPEMIAIISFPDSQTIKDMINGENFKRLGEMRSRVFERLNLVICSEL